MSKTTTGNVKQRSSSGRSRRSNQDVRQTSPEQVQLQRPHTSIARASTVTDAPYFHRPSKYSYRCPILPSPEQIHLQMPHTSIARANIVTDAPRHIIPSPEQVQLQMPHTSIARASTITDAPRHILPSPEQVQLQMQT
jgi:hypothetical protein